MRSGNKFPCRECGDLRRLHSNPLVVPEHFVVSGKAAEGLQISVMVLDKDGNHVDMDRMAVGASQSDAPADGEGAVLTSERGGPLCCLSVFRLRAPVFYMR
jgi:hypothetical protein